MENTHDINLNIQTRHVVKTHQSYESGSVSNLVVQQNPWVMVSALLCHAMCFSDC